MRRRAGATPPCPERRWQQRVCLDSGGSEGSRGLWEPRDPRWGGIRSACSGRRPTREEREHRRRDLRRRGRGRVLAAILRRRVDQRSSRIAAARSPCDAGDLGGVPVPRATPPSEGGSSRVDDWMRTRADSPNHRSRWGQAHDASHPNRTAPAAVEPVHFRSRVTGHQSAKAFGEILGVRAGRSGVQAAS